MSDTATRDEIEAIIDVTTKMARRLGYEFVVDPAKLERYEAYRQALEEIASGLNGRLDKHSLPATTAYTALYPEG